MKTERTSIGVSSLLALLAVVNTEFSTLFAQGSLTPPGAPAPTMKTLAQIEPRIAVNFTNTPGDPDSLFKITQPGSYYLTGNITGVANKAGIEIAASGVTLDLMGFEVVGINNSLDGITVSVPGALNLSVANGTVRNWTFNGVDAGSVNAQNSLFKNLRLSQNGADGIFAGNGSMIAACAAYGNGNIGINASGGSTILNCVARNNTASGIDANNSCNISQCTVSFNGGNGIDANNACNITGCLARSNIGHGIVADAGSTVTDCTAQTNGGDGIQTSDGCTIKNCTANNNTSRGIAANDGCTIVDCTSVSNSIGFELGIACNSSRCTAQANASYGLYTGPDSTVMNCTARTNRSDGIYADSHCVVSQCTALKNAANGIHVSFDCRVVDNYCEGNANGAGIRAESSSNHIEGNTVNINGTGILATNSDLFISNVIIRNKANRNGSIFGTGDYQVTGNNAFGPVIGPASLATNCNSHANISY